MHTRRLACFFIGMWLGGSVLMGWMVLRYPASGQNRSALETWGMAQIAIGLGFFFFLLFGTREGKFALGMALLMVLVVVLQRWPFSLLHAGYAGLEAGKLALGVALAAKLAFSRGGRSGDFRKQLDMVDKRDYGHVDR
jgi:hypothetical protein